MRYVVFLSIKIKRHMKIKITLTLSFFACLANILHASKIIVSTDIGFDPIDNTSFLQYAFQETTEDTIVVDFVGMDWNTGPLRIERNDITIIFEEGVVLQALFGEFDIFDSLIRINDKSNINIIGYHACLLYTSPSPRDQRGSRMPSSA